jgi:hypothetical protein
MFKFTVSVATHSMTLDGEYDKCFNNLLIKQAQVFP